MNRQDLQLNINAGERSLTLRDVAMPLFRQRRLLIWTFVTLVCMTLLAVILFPNTYKAKMKILVKRERVNAAVSAVRDTALSNNGDVSEEELNSEVELLRSRDLLEKVVVACNLQQPQSSAFWGHIFPATRSQTTSNQSENAKKVSKAVALLEKKLQIEPLKKTNLIQITYDSPDPQLSARVLSVLGNLYLEKTVEVHRSPGAFEFFQTESQRYKNDLHNSEMDLTQFDRNKGVADPQLERQIALQKLAEFEANYRATQVAIREAEKRNIAVAAQLANTPQQTMSQVRTSDNPYLTQQLKTTLLNLELKRTELSTRFQPEYPPLQEVTKQIEQTTEAIQQADKSPHREETSDRNPSYDWLQAEFTKSAAELATLQARSVETQNVIREYRAQLDLIDVNGATQRDLVRDVNEAEGNYLLYVKKREEARIGDALDQQRIVNVAIAETPIVPAVPTRPHWAITLFLGVILAGIASPALAFIVDHYDPSLRTPDELYAVLQVPILAALPKSNP